MNATFRYSFQAKINKIFTTKGLNSKICVTFLNKIGI